MPESKLTLGIAQEIFSRYPDVAVCGLLIDGLTSVSTQLDDSELSRLAAASLTSQGITIDALPKDARIASWRLAFRKQGLRPTSYRSSPEALARRFLRGQNIATPMPVVNAYNIVSVRFLAPIGGYDVKRLPGRHICLRLACPDKDTFNALGGRGEDIALREEVVVYAVGDEIVCWAFNHRDSASTCLQEETETAVFLSEALTDDQKDVSLLALEEMARILLDKDANVGPILVANNENPTVAFPG